jgi:hypothetical protein
MDKQTIQWILSVIAIPAITLLGWTVFENKSEIAVLDAKFTADHDILVTVSNQLKAQNDLLIRAVTKLENLEGTVE